MTLVDANPRYGRLTRALIPSDPCLQTVAIQKIAYKTWVSECLVGRGPCETRQR